MPEPTRDRRLDFVGHDDDDDWQLRAACAGMDGDLFFPSKWNVADARAAKAICAQCPVRLDCLEAGLWEHHGIWGGLSEKERRAERRRRANGSAA